MDSFEINKLLGTFLGVVFVVFSVSLVSDAIFAAHSPETPGYAIEVPDEPAAGGPAADEGPSALDLLATADPAAGEAIFRRCASCHTIEAGGANKVGPNLHDVLGRVVASHEGFSYSGAMTEYSEGGTKTWEFENISEFLQNPRGYVPGTIMAFAGLRDAQDEANLIAYINAQSDDPMPLPEPAAEEETAEGGATAEGEEAAPAEGEEAAPAEGEEAAPAEGEEAAPAEGEEAAPAEGEEAAPAEGEEAAPAEGEEAAPAEGEEAAPAEGEEAAPAEGEEAAPAEGEEAAPAEGEEAAPAEGEEAAPAESEETAPADGGDAAPAQDQEAAPTQDGQDTEAAPVEPTEVQDGTSASPETDAGTPATDGEVTDEEPRAPAQD